MSPVPPFAPKDLSSPLAKFLRAHLGEQTLNLLIVRIRIEFTNMKNIPTKKSMKRISATTFCIAFHILVGKASAFILVKQACGFGFQQQQLYSSSSSKNNNNWDDNVRELRDIQEKKTQSDLVNALFSDGTSSSSPISSLSSLIPVYLAGQARLSVSTNQTANSATRQTVLVLTREKSSKSPSSSLLLPLMSTNQLRLVSFAVAKRPLSKSVMLGLNSLLVNRDGALFDNLPWSTWSVDPQQRNRDAAGNNINEKFHLGKRDAYYRFMGKDWQGRSLAIGNLALRLKYWLEEAEQDKNTEGRRNGQEGEGYTDIENDESRKAMAIRILQLRVRELRMELADVESQLAVARNNNDDQSSLSPSMAELEEMQSNLSKEIQNYGSDLVELTTENKQDVFSFVKNVLERVASWTTSDGENAAPYRGAMGYAPMLDSKEDVDGSLLSYTSPFDLLKEILEDQLNAKVIGCVLENMSLLRGNTALGGAIVLQRITPTKTMNLAGEEVEFKDYDEQFGNQGIVGGETMIVECDGDEAIGAAFAYGVPLKVESGLFDQASILAEPTKPNDGKSNHILDVLPIWRPVDDDLSLEVEGDVQRSENPSPISIPRSTMSLFDEIAQEKPRGSTLFPTDTPIKSLEELDGLSDEDKAKTLLEMSNFSGRLPRPRAVRTADTNPLDVLLLPLIDESVRRQYMIRDAEQRGDLERAAELKASKSRLQKAKEKAEAARKDGMEDLADEWDNEAEFLESLRADVTQDEGSYSRFLDRDDWYERDRQATAKRVKRSSFGTLLDGIE